MHKLLILFILFLLFAISSLSSQTAVQKILPPDEAPDQWLLAHVDVETTGLIPGFHEMIDIGVAITDLDGNLVDTLFLRIQPRHPERLSEGAYRVNAFSAARWDSLDALTPEKAVSELIDFHKKTAGDKQILMIAFNSHFDSAFLDHLFRSVDKSWRELYYYFILDLPSMAWSQGFRDLTAKKFMEEFKIEDEPHIAHLHTGITGALKNVRIYQALMRHQQK